MGHGSILTNQQMDTVVEHPNADELKHLLDVHGGTAIVL